MLTVRGVFNGHEIKFTGNQLPQDPQPVLITFLGADSETTTGDLAVLAASGGSFDFLNEDDDIYDDQDLKALYL